jgi:hypothetical protein
MISVKGYIPWVGQVERKRVGGKIRIAVGEYQWVVGFLSCEWTMRDHPLLWIASPKLGSDFLLRFGTKSICLGGTFVPSSLLQLN